MQLLIPRANAGFWQEMLNPLSSGTQPAVRRRIRFTVKENALVGQKEKNMADNISFLSKDLLPQTVQLQISIYQTAGLLV